MKPLILIVSAITLVCIAHPCDAEVSINRLLCRVRFTNISETQSVARKVLENAQPAFSFVLSNHEPIPARFQGIDPEDDRNMIEALYEFDVKHITQINRLRYTVSMPFRDMRPDQDSFRCSNVIQRGLNKEFSESYLVNISAYAAEISFVHYRSATFMHQARKDCYVSDGYEHPYTLNQTHRYVADGEQFDCGCSYVGTCTDGTLTAVSTCPPAVYPPSTYPVRMEGQCCNQAVTKATAEQAGCPKRNENESGSRPRPWQVRFGRQKSGDQCDGVIVEKLWFLTTKSCVSESTGLKFLRPPSVGPRARTVTVREVKNVTNDPAIDLALVKISSPFAPGDWTTALQKVNLPWSEAACKKFLETDCRLHLAGATEHRDRITGTVKAAQGLASSLKRVETPAPILRGSGAAGWYESAGFLVGIYAGSAMKSGADGEIGNLISICPFLDSIREKIRD